MNFNLEIVKILAYGSSKRFMYVLDPLTRWTWCIRINDELYQSLKRIGVPTAQSLRDKKK